MQSSGYKTCRKCLKDKSVISFPIITRCGKSYLNSYCTICLRDSERKRRIDKGDEIRLRDRIRWIAEKREKSKEKRRIYYIENRSKFIASASKRYEKLKKAGIKRHCGEKRRLLTLADIGVSESEYFLGKEDRKRKVAINADGVGPALRSRARHYRSVTGGVHYVELVGASPEFVHAKLSELFYGVMNWNNHGTYWHIDHYVPISYFNVSDPNQAKIAFNWRNLRPLTASANMQKAASIPSDHLEFIEFIKSGIENDKNLLDIESH